MKENKPTAYALGKSVVEKSIRGFTLMELIVCLAITAILLTVATPSLASLYRKTQLESDLAVLFSNIQYARTASIRSGERVRMCRSGDGILCDSNRRWENGWMIYADSNDNGLRDSGEIVHRVQIGLSDIVSLDFGSRNQLIYKPDGTIWPNGTFRMCDKSLHQPPKAVVVYWSGRVRIDNKLPSGREINCE